MNKSKRHKRDYLRRRKMEDTGIFGGMVCPECGKDSFYFYRFDANCCLGCNIWLSEKCSDSNCRYCSHRPESPLEALFLTPRPLFDEKMWRRKNYAHKERGKLRKRTCRR